MRITHNNYLLLIFFNFTISYDFFVASSPSCLLCNLRWNMHHWGLHCFLANVMKHVFCKLKAIAKDLDMSRIKSLKSKCLNFESFPSLRYEDPTQSNPASPSLHFIRLWQESNLQVFTACCTFTSSAFSYSSTLTLCHWAITRNHL